MEPAISARGITKTFPRPGLLARLRRGGHPSGGRAEVLRGVDLEVRPGEVFGLLGPNGSGKTTLLEVLAGRLAPTAGRASVAGRDVTREPLAARRAAGYCPAGGRGLDPRLGIHENLRFFALLGGLSPAESRARIERLLRLCGIDHAPPLPVGRLSDGERQRAALARALLLDPPVLLLDEPTRALDPDSARRFGREVLRLAREDGKTVLLITHRIEEALWLCDRAAVLAAGRITRAGAPRAILLDPPPPGDPAAAGRRAGPLREAVR